MNDDTPVPEDLAKKVEMMRNGYMDDGEDTPPTKPSLDEMRSHFPSGDDTSSRMRHKLDTVSDPDVSKRTDRSGRNEDLPKGYVVDDGITVLKEKIGEGGMGKVYRARIEPYMIVRNRVLRGETPPSSLNDKFRNSGGDTVEISLSDIKQGIIIDDDNRSRIQKAAEKKREKRTHEIMETVRKAEKLASQDIANGRPGPYKGRDTSKIELFETHKRTRDKFLMDALTKDFRSENNMVAVKFMDPEFAEKQNMKDRFNQEARAARKLRHPNLTRAVEYGHDAESGMYYMVMEYVPNVMALEDMADTLDPKAAMKILIRALRGLKYIHDHGKYHRDVKPSNILVDENTLFKELPKSEDSDETTFDILDDPDVRLTDLGLLKDTEVDDEGRITRTIEKELVMGTPYYMSPEGLDGVTYMDAQSDMYSFGGTAFKLLTGERPYEGSIMEVMRQIRAGSPVRIRDTEGGKDVHPRLAEVMDRCFMRMGRDRLTSTELLAELEELDRDGMYYAPSPEERAAEEVSNRERKRVIRKSIKSNERMVRMKKRLKVFDHTKESTVLVNLYDEMLELTPRKNETVVRRIEFIESSIGHCKYINNNTKLERLGKDYAWEESNRVVMGVDRIRQSKKMKWPLKAAMAASVLLPTAGVVYLLGEDYLKNQEYLRLLNDAKGHLERAATEEDLEAAARMIQLAADT
ncbi:MAG: serine/threonine-protein kinase, partial [Candidatus Aenigmarchaeota archaeon]